MNQNILGQLLSRFEQQQGAPEAAVSNTGSVTGEGWLQPLQNALVLGYHSEIDRRIFAFSHRSFAIPCL